MSSFHAVNPSTGLPGLVLPELSEGQLTAVLGRARETSVEWAQTPLAQRLLLIGRVAELLRARAEALALLMAQEMGKPLAEGVAEANKCAWLCEWVVEQAPVELAPRAVVSDASHSEVRVDPLGVVAGVMPWNFPLWQVFRYAAPALAVGNGVLVKHAPSVPACALAIQQLFEDAGAPEGLVQQLFVDVTTPGLLDRIVRDPAIAALTVTGSERAGRAVAAAAGAALKKVVLELGGSDPFIVLDDADLEQAAKVGVASRCLNGGQSCIAAKRFIVHERCAEAFLPLLRAELQGRVVGDPLSPGTHVGPMARRDLRDQLHEQVLASVGMGAKVELGGELPEGPGWFYPVTMLTGLTDDMPAWRDETFGPVAAVRVARDDDEALAMANHTRFGLGASVWTSSSARAQRFVSELHAGGVFVNGMVKSDPRLPFGGVGVSGFGRELGREGFLEFANLKTVWKA